MSVAYGFDEILFRYYREIPHLCYSNRAVRNLAKFVQRPPTIWNKGGEISYTVEQNRLIRTHKIKLTDILEYLYKKECRQELDSPYICAMKEFYERRLNPYRPSFCERCSKSYGLFFICCGGMDQPKYLKGVPTWQRICYSERLFCRIFDKPVLSSHKK